MGVRSSGLGFVALTLPLVGLRGGFSVSLLGVSAFVRGTSLTRLFVCLASVFFLLGSLPGPKHYTCYSLPTFLLSQLVFVITA